MSEELRPCPFCGKSDIHIEQKGTFFWCECYDCGAISREHHTLPGVNVLQSEDIARGYWNQRPLEDALHARIAELEHDLTNKEIEYTDLWDDALALQSRIAELESLVEQLIWVGNDLLVSNTNPVTITLFNGLACNAKERAK